MNEVILKVAHSSNSNKVAGAIVKNFEEGKTVKIHVIGAGALHQGIKGVAIARGFIAPQGKDLSVIPGFFECEIDGKKITGLTLKLVIE